MGELCGQISLAAPEWTNEEIGLYGRMYWLPGNKSMTSCSAPSSLQAEITVENSIISSPLFLKLALARIPWHIMQFCHRI